MFLSALPDARRRPSLLKEIEFTSAYINEIRIGDGREEIGE